MRGEVIKGFGLLSLLRGRAYGEDNDMTQVRTDDDEDKAEEVLQAARPLGDPRGSQMSIDLQLQWSGQFGHGLGPKCPDHRTWKAVRV